MGLTTQHESNQNSRDNRTVVIEAPQFYPALFKAVKKSCKVAGHGDDAVEALVNALLLHIIQFQSNNDVAHLERHTLMALNIIRDNGIDQPDFIISSWTPMLLAITSKFITLKLVERSPIWRLDAHVEGSLYITPE